jgi:Sel1 repeat
MAAPAAGVKVRGALVAEKTEWDGVSLAKLNVTAESGDGGAQCALGKKIKKEDAAGALCWFRAAAEQGHAEAQSELGWCLQYNWGVVQDAAEAASWYRKSAKQGHADAQFRLGDCLIFGCGVGRDYAKAASWFRKAAEQGHTDAQLWLGNCFKGGHGVDQGLRRRRSGTARRPNKATQERSTVSAFVSNAARESIRILRKRRTGISWRRNKVTPMLVEHTDCCSRTARVSHATVTRLSFGYGNTRTPRATRLLRLRRRPVLLLQKRHAARS